MIAKSVLIEKLKRAPDRPGVYLFKGGDGAVIYVGKAKSLRGRLGAYARGGGDEWDKVSSIVQSARDVDYILTETELEALLLECTLIKKHSPRFNVRMKDDTGYPYLKITAEKYPRLVFARRREDDGERYFGPYASSGNVRRTMRFLQKLFSLRTCAELKKGPCMYYHIGECGGPCCGETTEEEYMRNVESVAAFLRGRRRGLVEELEREMEAAARRMEFERAAVMRDRAEALRDVISEGQKVVLPAAVDCDVIGAAAEEGAACVEVMVVRDGLLCGHEPFFMEDPSEGAGGTPVEGFIKLYYAQAQDVPPVVIVGADIGERELVEKMLREKAGRAVEIKSPKRGRLKKLLLLAEKNAEHRLEAETRRRLEREGAGGRQAAALGRRLGGGFEPKRIVGLDVSTIHGEATVGAAVTFRDGMPLKSGYRKFIIRGKTDDFSAMREMAARYFRRVRDGKEDAPDVVIVDGGLPQVSAVEEGLAEAAPADAPEIMGFAKESRISHRAGEDEPIRFDGDEEALRLVMRVVAEAHRFAVTFHRKKRSKKMFD
ncbi:MAG: excinuclease ABC subunit UvrC [bacterium]